MTILYGGDDKGVAIVHNNLVCLYYNMIDKIKPKSASRKNFFKVKFSTPALPFPTLPNAFSQMLMCAIVVPLSFCIKAIIIQDSPGFHLGNAAYVFPTNQTSILGMFVRYFTSLSTCVSEYR